MINQLLADASNISQEYNFEQIQPEHLLYAMISNPEWERLLAERGIDTTALSSDLAGALRFNANRVPAGVLQVMISEEVNQAIKGATSVGPKLVDSLINQMRDRSSLQKTSPNTSKNQTTGLATLNAPLPDIDELLEGLEEDHAYFGFNQICNDVFPKETRAEQGGRSGAFGSDEVGILDGARTNEADVRRAEKPVEKPTLSAKERAEAQRAVDRSIRDLTEMFWSGDLDLVIGRDAEIDQICEVLMRRRKSNVLLVGDPGVGKTALMEGVAARVATSKDPALSSRPVLQASLGALVSGARYRGDFEVRMELLIELAQSRRAILFFDEMQMLIGSGATAERGMDGANLLKPALARDGLSLVGATTHEEAAGIRSDPALMRRFETVLVREPEVDLMRRILSGAAKPYLDHHRVRADERTLGRIVDFAERYLRDRRFPDKAFDLLDTACVRARLLGRSTIKVEDIRDAVRRLGGNLPLPHLVGEEDRDQTMKHIFEVLNDRVGGHPSAIQDVIKSLGDRLSGQPLGLNLVGPNGVGRRTLAYALARALGLRVREINVGFGADQVKTGILEALNSGTDLLILLNVDSDLDRTAASAIGGMLSTGVIRTPSGQEIGLGNTIICIRSNEQRGAIGFSSSEKPYTIGIPDIRKIFMPSFSDKRIFESVKFELERLSILWSDIGSSRSLPTVESVVNGSNMRDCVWADIAKACSEASNR
jgi:ATP-dependent Clp protease ATP-binding subunit ClpA